MDGVGRLLLTLVASVVSIPACSGKLEFVYHNYTAVHSYLSGVHRLYPHITHLYSIGQSVQGRQLWVLAVGESPDKHVLLRPEVKYVANIHGNEVTGREILLHLIERLVTEYNRDPVVTRILKTMRVHVLVSINPDGFENATNHRGEGHCTGAHGRANANGFDLNRNFPDYFERERRVDHQPESRAMMAWLTNNQFVLSAQLHDGALVANYPYDSYKGDGRTKYSQSPDDDVFRHLSSVYANSHMTMSQGNPCWGEDDSFPGGIVNGAQWYPVVGGLQDFNYIFAGCMELTLELSCCKYSHRSELPHKWKENKEALLNFIQQAHMGVKGLVRDLAGRPVDGAHVTFKDRSDHYVNTTVLGEYWKLLLPGNYTIMVEAVGYEPFSQPFRVKKGVVTLLNIALLDPEASSSTLRLPSPVAMVTLIWIAVKSRIS